MPKDRLYSTACALAIVVCVLATIPVLEMGVNDDWSYTWSALGLANTGHLIYSGWSEPMVGVQAFFAALLIRLFGFSFTLVRLSTLPYAAGCGYLAYKLGRGAGLNPPYSAFGALTVTLSPLFLPLSASFMTDVPSIFFWLACVYCAWRAARAKGMAPAASWIAASAAAGIAGGSVRQVVWMVPLATLPVVAWLRRREAPVVAMAALACCVTAAAGALSMRWFLAQPYVRLLAGSEAPGWPAFLPWLLGSIVWLTVGGAIFLFPVLAMHVAGWRKEGYVRADLGIAIEVAAGLAAMHWWLHQDLLVGNTVTLVGVLGGVAEAIGSRPILLGGSMRAVLKLALAVGGVATLAAIAGIVRRGGLRRIARPVRGGESEGLAWFVWTMAPSCILYGLILLYRGIMFDRYLVPLFPLLIVPLLWGQQKRRSSPTLAAWAVLALTSLYGVAATHDYFAGCRARHEAVLALTATGIPRTSITVGLEGDAWAELNSAGHIAMAFDPVENRNRVLLKPRPVSTAFPETWTWEKTPSIHPVYFVSYSRFSKLKDAAPPVAYKTWLPPGTQQVYTQAE